MKFTPSNFILNIPYMLKGMLGLFVGLGVIALSIIVLNKLTEEKDD